VVSQLTRAPDHALRRSTAPVGESGIRETDENFPVALRLLPARLRRDLSAVYGVARAIDDLGDDAPGDRLALLAEFEADLRRIWTGKTPTRTVLVRLVPTVNARRLSIEPFLALLAANRLDQERSSSDSWADLKHYCSLSADPIGRIVLEVIGATGDDLVAWSDDVCTALQVLEHCQDVAEDRGRGRTYLPADDLQAHGVQPADLDAPTTSPAVRALVSHEVERAEMLLASGRLLVRRLRGAGRVAVAGYVAGGLATADALRRADFDVLAVVPKPRTRDTARHALRLLVGRR
jgi:squalene synthase HpnC